MCSKIEDKLFWLLGMLLCATAFKFGGNALSNYVLILIFIIQIYQVLQCGKVIKIYKYKLSVYLFIGVFIFSFIINVFNVDSYWQSALIKITFKLIVMVFPLIILFTKDELNRYRTDFFYGLYASAVVQMLWGFMQIIIYMITGISINQVVFGDILRVDIGDGSWTKITGIGIRATGFNWEPAQYGMLLLIGYVLSRSKWLKFLFVVSIILSSSGTGFLSLAIILMFELFVERKYKLRNLLNSKTIIIVIGICLVTFGMFILFNEQVSSVFNYVYEHFFVQSSRLIKNFSGKSNEMSFNTHLFYYQNLLDIISNSNILNILFGYGTLIVGRIYSSMYGTYSYLNYAWNPESDFVCILIGNGIIGAIVYYYTIFKAYVINKEYVYKKLILIIFFAGLFYLHLRGYYLLIILLMLANKEDIKCNV